MLSEGQVINGKEITQHSRRWYSLNEKNVEQRKGISRSRTKCVMILTQGIRIGIAAKMLEHIQGR